MKKFVSILLLIAVIAFQSCKSDQKPNALKYPKTDKGNVVDTLFNNAIADPYRWLEDDLSEETMRWVEVQNKTTFSYLGSIPGRQNFKDRLTELWNYEKISAPFKKGDYTYFYKNDGLQNQYVIYRKKGDQQSEVFLNPNLFSKDGTTSLGQLSFSRDGSLLAYSISEGGSDWRKVIVMNANTKEVLEDTLVDIKFSGLSWYKNEGFYYSSYEKPDGSELSAMTDQHILFYHKLGTPQSKDEKIFGESAEEKRRYVGGRVTKDDRFLVITGSVSTSGNDMRIIDLEEVNPTVRDVVEGFESDSYVMTHKNGKLFIVTNHQAPNKRLVIVDADHPEQKNWVDLIPEQSEVLSPSMGGGYLFTEYMKDAVSVVYQYDFSGNKIREITLPGIGSAGGFNGEEDDTTLYYSFTNYYTPQSIFAFNPEKGASSDYWKPEIAFDQSDYVSEQKFYPSKDGTIVPMIITYKKGLQKSGNNPCMLYGYGGFNISLTPSFSVANLVWMEAGGIYAVPNLRGGGEYGKSWHNAGIKMKKQNVFDDFIAAAEYLIKEQYTSSDFLAIKGGSNGGLLVGATMTQRPNLMKVAIPAVGVLDMLRYHKFTAGAGWAYDYGTADDNEEMLEYLLGYSPVHNVEEGVKYPATLIMTGDHDDRVVPAHSFKFAATLQVNQDGSAPVLIRVETNAGHGAGTPVDKIIQQAADVISFTRFEMGL